MTAYGFFLFFLITTTGRLPLQFCSDCSSAFQILRRSWFLASNEKGMSSIARADICTSSPPEPIGVERRSPSPRSNFSYRSSTICCCSRLPFALQDCVFIIILRDKKNCNPNPHDFKTQSTTRHHQIIIKSSSNLLSRIRVLQHLPRCKFARGEAIHWKECVLVHIFFDSHHLKNISLVFDTKTFNRPGQYYVFFPRWIINTGVLRIHFYLKYVLIFF